MNSTPRSLWDRLHLLLLRGLSILLAVVDGLFGVRWGERLLLRMAGHWQAQLEELDGALARLEAEREMVRLQAEALAIHSAAVYLSGRRLARNQLRFDPADPRDDELLTAAIDLLVVEHLAEIEIVEVEPEHYVYDLEPDWTAIRARLTEAVNLAEPEFADWLREGLLLIDKVVSSETVLSVK